MRGPQQRPRATVQDGSSKRAGPHAGHRDHLVTGDLSGSCPHSICIIADRQGPFAVGATMGAAAGDGNAVAGRRCGAVLRQRRERPRLGAAGLAPARLAGEPEGAAARERVARELRRVDRASGEMGPRDKREEDKDGGGTEPGSVLSGSRHALAHTGSSRRK